MPRRDDLPSLTGLRGIAAWLVVIAHTDSFFVAAQPAWLEYAWRVCANLGMTTFFVLSGFVIHYNYGANIATKGAPAIRSFLIARFARLYPLYLLVLLLSIALSPSIIGESAFRTWSWRYLTMTQDWTPTLLDGKLLATLYFGSAWSISAEVGLYIFYLALAVPLDGLRNARATLCVIAGLSILGIIFIGGYAGGFWLGRLPQQDWWLFLSPFCRVPEFSLGALIAQLYLISPDLPNARWTGLVGGCWIVAAFAACYVFPNFQAAFGFAPGVAAVMFYFAFYRSRAAVLIETPIMLVLGEASYSIYMLHGFALWYVMKQSPYLPSALRIAIAWGVLLVLAIIVYRWFEAPLRRFIKRLGTKAGSMISNEAATENVGRG
jgi:peptidoglycan/LPS O-acetylase OafA/YrhL